DRGLVRGRFSAVDAALARSATLATGRVGTVGAVAVRGHAVLGRRAGAGAVTGALGRAVGGELGKLDLFLGTGRSGALARAPGGRTRGGGGTVGRRSRRLGASLRRLDGVDQLTLTHPSRSGDAKPLRELLQLGKHHAGQTTATAAGSARGGFLFGSHADVGWFGHVRSFPRAGS